jgi:hypothetical protein
MTQIKKATPSFQLAWLFEFMESVLVNRAWRVAGSTSSSQFATTGHAWATHSWHTWTTRWTSLWCGWDRKP